MSYPHYGPDSDDRISDYISDKLVELSLLARTERIPRGEKILDLPDEAITPPDLATMAEAWDWLWNNDRSVYHREMERAIDGATEWEVNQLLDL